MPDIPLQVATAERVDRLCDQFEVAFNHGDRPTIEAFLATAPESDRHQLLAALVGLDWELRNSAGESPALDDYCRRFPDDIPVVEAAWEELSRSSGLRPGQTNPSAAQTKGGQSADTSVDAARAVPPPKSSEALPKSFGRFEISRQLGKGAFGTVYLARDPKLDRNVALKVPQAAEFHDDTERQRFLREAKAAAGLSHPNICRVHEVSEADGRDFIVMEYVEGKPLDDYVARGKIQPKQAVQVVRKLALALEEAHRRGIVHRDIKPANIMINVRGEPIIMDFGLARVPRTTDVALTQSGMIMGSPAYMSPEQARGAVDEIGPAADIYSLGVVLYELLCGKRPFTGTVMQVIGDIQHVEPPPPTQHRPDLDPSLEQICLKAIAKQSKNRFASMKEFAAALGDYLKEPAKTVATETKVPVELENFLASMSDTERNHKHVRKSMQKLADDLEPSGTEKSLKKRTRPKSRSVVSSIWNWRTLASVGGGLAVLFASIYFAVILFSTPQGTVVVNVLDKNIAVSFANDEITLDSSGKKYMLKPTEKKTLKILVDGMEIESGTQEISVSKNEEKIITAKLLPDMQLELAIAGETKIFAVPGNGSVIAGSLTEPAQQRVVSMIEHLGGKITRDAKRPNAPIIGVNFFDTKTKPDDAQIAELRHLTELETLGLWGSGKLTNESLRAIGRFRQLKSLDLGLVPIDDDGVAHLTGLDKLTGLNLSYTKVTDGAMRHVAKLKSLRSLALDNTQITDEGLAAIKDLTELRHLNLLSTRVRGSGLEHLTGMRHLEQLWLGNSPVEDDGLEHVRLLPALVQLYLGKTKVTDQGLDHLAGLIGIKELDLRETSVTAQGMEKLRRSLPTCRVEWDGGVIDTAPREQALAIIHQLGGIVEKDLNRLGMPVVMVQLNGTKVNDDGLKRLAAIPSLEELRLFDTRVTDNGLAIIGNLPELRSLDVRYAWDVSNETLERAGKLPKLTCLLMSATRISDAGLKHLDNKISLQRLDVSFSDNVTDAGVDSLVTLSNLRDLYIAGTKVTDTGIAKLTKLAKLEHLNLGHCKSITDAGIEHLQVMKNLKMLILKDTNITMASIEKLKTALPNLTVDGSYNADCATLVESAETWTDLFNGKDLTGMTAAREQALTIIRQLGGVVEEDPNVLGKPIVQINLWGKKLNDNGLKHLAMFPSLQVCVLFNTPVTDHGLAVISRLPELRLLDLRYSSAGNGTLERASKLPKLTCLWMSSTRITEAGLKHLENKDGLQGLDISWNDNVTDTGIDSVITLNNLRVLHMAATKITDAGVAKLKQLKKLESLNLNTCKLVTDASVEHLQAMTNLKTLILKDSNVSMTGIEKLKAALPHVKFDGIIPDDCSQSVPLETEADPDRRAAEWVIRYSVGGVRLSGSGKDVGISPGNELPKEPFHLIALDLWGKKFPPEEIENLRGLKHLEGVVLFGCQSVDDRGLAVLGAIPSITMLVIGANPFTGEGLSALASLKKLQDLAITENPRVDDQCIAHLNDLTELRLLTLGLTRVSGEGLKHLAKMTKLEMLSIYSTEVTDDDLVHLLPMENLRILNVGRHRRPNFTGAGLAHLKPLKWLKDVDLSDADITDEGLKGVAALENLEGLHLLGTKVTDAGLKHLYGMKTLQRLNLKGTSVTEAGLQQLRAALPECDIVK